MNNTTVFDNESIWITEQIMQPLYTVTPDGKGVMPWLATGYKLSPNKLTYTFTLRKGVKFSTGKPMTSADVKFSLDQSRAASKGWGYIDSAIKSVAAPTPSTVVVNLKHPWAPLLARCPIAQPRCEQEDPALTVSPGDPGHSAACHFAFAPGGAQPASTEAAQAPS